MDIYNSFIDAIHEKKCVLIVADTYEKGIIERICIPFDYGPSRKYKDGINRYHLFDLDSPDGSHNLALKPDQILKIEILNDHFDPNDYVHWETNWYISRDWGPYS